MHLKLWYMGILLFDKLQKDDPVSKEIIDVIKPRWSTKTPSR
nr:MAG TPA: hypothetical protein [Caudoviricetes sp.]